MTTNPTAANDQQTTWHNCDGQVGHLVHCLRWRRRSSQVRRGALFTALAVVLFAGNYFYSDMVAEMEIKVTGCACDHYREEMRAFYCDKSRSELEPKLWEHLSRCPDCSKDLIFFGGIGQHVAHVAAPKKGAHFPAANRPISFDGLLRTSTLAVRR